MKRAAAVVVAVTLIVGSDLDAGDRAVAGEPPAPGDVRPEIEWRRIPFGAVRKRQTAAYSERHYGRRTYRLRSPNVIVEHYTAGTSLDAAWNHFAANGRNLGELPGVCAHFLIDTDGTIHQLVNVGIRCRHAIGMNWTSIGIEHVGTSARQVLGNRDMMRASLRLTAWLMVRFGIAWGNVIGHAEILQSPFHRERYPSWRCRTHADFDRDEMRKYRRRLKRTAADLGVPIGARPRWVDSSC
jgi:N-acetylmuramoyl-L-alanine amidase